MSVLEELQTVLGSLPVPIETGVFSEKAPDEYLVLVPMADSFALHGDNLPHLYLRQGQLYQTQKCGGSETAECRFHRHRAAVYRL